MRNSRSSLTVVVSLKLASGTEILPINNNSNRGSVAIAQSVICLPNKQEDLSLSSQYSHKMLGYTAHNGNPPSLGWWRQGDPWLCWLGNLAESVSSRFEIVSGK